MKFTISKSSDFWHDEDYEKESVIYDLRDLRSLWIVCL